MAQWVKAPSTKPNNLTLIIGIHKLSSDMHDTCMHSSVHTCVHTHNHVILGVFKLRKFFIAKQNNLIEEYL